ncbi:STT3A-like protein [Mya arenaria]|uniref:Dolichyl-diphosphooligosaccharide--protein glycosyltransferase subunit STT3A n=1 Tax=Mya arenaria TaxID=6604 RepID=A0ABY7F966_MYAAR|nr:STT3A-like protein [Mya arenaria]
MKSSTGGFGTQWFLKMSSDKQDTLLKMSVLTIAAILSFSTRLFSVLRFESVIHEFDPYFNYRTTRFLTEEGFYSFHNWFDDRAWYPLGRIIGGTIYPGLMLTSAILYHLAWFLNITIEIRNVCVFLAPLFSSLTVLDAGAGLIAAAMIAIVPGYISRSVAGSYDNEGIAIFCMLLTYMLWIKAVKTGSVYALGTILSMQISFVGFQPVQSSEHMAALGVFGLCQIHTFIDYVRSKLTRDQFNLLFRSIVLLVGSVGTISVAIATALGTGLYFCFKKLTDANIFIIMYGVTSIYFAGVMVRLMLVLAPVMCILSAIGVSGILSTYMKNIDNPAKKDKKPKKADLSYPLKHEDAKVMSWWDYGYQITAMANRTILAMSSTEDKAYEIMRELDVNYVLVIFGGLTGYSSDDINKFLWMVRIGGSTDRGAHIKESDYYTPQGKPTGYDRVRNAEIGNKDFELDVLEEAYTTEHWLVRIYKVKDLDNRGL